MEKRKRLSNIFMNKKEQGVLEACVRQYDLPTTSAIRSMIIDRAYDMVKKWPDQTRDIAKAIKVLEGESGEGGVSVGYHQPDTREQREQLQAEAKADKAMANKMNNGLNERGYVDKADRLRRN